MYFLYLILLVLLPINIILHECGHCLHYLLSGIKIRAIAVNGLICAKGEKRWKCVWCKSAQTNFILPQIIENKDVQYYIEKIKKNLLFGPAVSVCLLILWISILTIYSINETDNIIILILLWLNVAANLSILQGCFNTKREAIGDLAAYKLLKHSEEKIYPYLLDYFMYNMKICTGFEKILNIDFSKLSDEEKCDWALDIIVLFMLGHITEISDEISQYIRRYVKTMLKKNPVDKGIALYIFELYLTGQEEKKCLPMQYVSNKPMESLFVLLEIDKIIIERWV